MFSVRTSTFVEGRKNLEHTIILKHVYFVQLHIVELISQYFLQFINLLPFTFT